MARFTGMRTALALAILITLAVPTAGRAEDLEPFGAAAGPVVADGERYAVFRSASDTVTVLDDVARTRRTLRVASECFVDDKNAAVGGGALLTRCGERGDRLVDLRTGAVRKLDLVTAVARSRETRGHNRFYVRGMGRRWIRLYAAASIRNVLVDRRTLAARLPRLGRRFALDLDAPSGRRVLCSGLNSPAQPDVHHGASPVPFSYEPSLGLLTFQPPTGMTLTRCSGSRRVLSDSGDITDVQAGGGVFTWIEYPRRQVAAYGRGGLVRYDFSAIVPNNQPLVAHTRRRLYLMWNNTIYVAPLPSGRARQSTSA